jgi:hypothetical protein
VQRDKVRRGETLEGGNKREENNKNSFIRCMIYGGT